MGQCHLKRKWELDSWDALVKATIKPPSYLGRWISIAHKITSLPTYTIVTKFQASTWDLWDNLFKGTKFQALSTWDLWDKPSKKARDKPSHVSCTYFSHPHLLWSEKNTVNMSRLGRILSQPPVPVRPTLPKGHNAIKCLESKREASKDYSQGGYFCMSSVHSIPYHLPRKFVLALLDSKSEVNTIHPTFAKELGLQIRSGAFWDAFWCRSAENRRHHSGYLWNGSRSLFGDEQATRSIEFASKKESNARDLQTSSWYQVINIDIRVIVLLCYDYILVPSLLQHVFSAYYGPWTGT